MHIAQMHIHAPPSTRSPKAGVKCLYKANPNACRRGVKPLGKLLNSQTKGANSF